MLTEDLSRLWPVQINERFLNEWWQVHALLWLAAFSAKPVNRKACEPKCGLLSTLRRWVTKAAFRLLHAQRQETFQNWLWFFSFLGFLTHGPTAITLGNKAGTCCLIWESCGPVCSGERADGKVHVKRPTHKNKGNQIKEMGILSTISTANCPTQEINSSIPVSL